MGKANEIIQWILIVLVVIVIVGEAVAVFLLAPKAVGFGLRIVKLAVAPWQFEKAIENAKSCETKDDCAYGSVMINKEDFGLNRINGLFDVEEQEQTKTITEVITGCLNKSSVTETLEKPFSEECVCISGQCEYIR